MRNIWEQWMVNGIHSFTKSGRMRRASYLDVCNWVLESWNQVTPECVKKAKVHNYDELSTSPNESDFLSSDESETGLESDLVQYSDILEAFHYESDEEFDGF